MKYKKLLELYIPLVDFIADIIGSNCEVLLHDIVDVENSVIAIRNGYISGRSLGCSLTDLGFKLLANKTYLRHSALVNYRSRNDRGENLISSTYYIKDEAGSLIGMLCVNILNTVDQRGHKFLSEEPLKAFFGNAVQLNGNEEITESLSTSLDHVVDNGIHKLIAKYNTAVDRMSPEEKSAIVQELRENGIFKIKGAITKAAASLKTSESTIYRYMAMK